MRQQMTIQKLVQSMLDAISSPLTEEEYRIFQFSRLNVLKRRQFSNIYRTLIIYLIRISIPQAFPERSKEIIDKLDEVYEDAYRDKQKHKEWWEISLIHR